MNNEHLVAIEISKKQNYIFKSNKLKENIGASLIIKYVTEDLMRAFIGDGQEIYCGGGNSYFKFNSEEEAKKFIRKMSFHILKNYEGLEFYASIKEGQFNKENMDALKKKLSEKKLKRQNSFKKVSFGIEEICKSTSTPCIEKIIDEKDESKERKVSQEAWIKNAFVDYLNKGEKSKYFKEEKYKEDYKKELIFFKELSEDREKERSYKLFVDNEYPLNLDKLEEDKNSQIALVSIDGNKMGNMVNYIKEKVKEENNLKEELEKFSNFIKGTYKEAFNKVKESLKSTKLNEKLPIRPLILAGDDVCYIIKSKYALKSVEIFSKSIEESNLLEKFPKFKELKIEKLTVGAGIVFINKKAPFNKAYDLAEDLGKLAKSSVGIKENISTVDWHILKGEFDDVENIRERINQKFKENEAREKQQEKQMFLRPLKIFDKDSGEEISLEKMLRTVNFIMENKELRLGKLNELLGIFDQGKIKIDLFVNKYRLSNSIKEINEKLGYEEYDLPYKDNKYHIHDIIEICNDKYYEKVGDNNE